MILVDVNLLLYARNAGAQQHARARDWLEERLSGSARVGLPWPTLLGFLRLITDPRIVPKPLTVTAAWQQVERWLDAPPAWIPQPTERHGAVLGRLLPATTSSRLVPDAHLAALAIEHGLTLCSNDGDFARFDELSWQNPLAARG